MAKESIYTIPVNDAFMADCECPLCQMHLTLENDAINFLMGSAYMEDDLREQTNLHGFCPDHFQKLFNQSNRLGIALMTHTHMNKVKMDIKKYLQKGPHVKSGLFSKKGTSANESSLENYRQELLHDCYVCTRVNNFFTHYLDTLFYMWKKEDTFVELFKKSKGFCAPHFITLYELAPKHLSGEELKNFQSLTTQLWETNFQRVSDDLQWFINKFDYRYKDEPWNNGKDAPKRAIEKISSMHLQ